MERALRCRSSSDAFEDKTSTALLVVGAALALAVVQLRIRQQLRVVVPQDIGRVTGAHLHWEVWVNGVQVNPLDWLDHSYP